MSGTVPLRLSIILAAFIVLSSVAFARHALADTCPAPTVAITDATRANATAAGIPTSATCWNPSDSSTGQAAGAAKLWLQQHATKNANIACLNSTFAERLEKFMQAVPGGPPTITDGYRGAAAQNAAKSNGASQVGWCSSYHNYGMAADFNNSSKTMLLWMRQNAPQYGLTPIPTLNVQTGCSYTSSFCDPAHIQIQGPHPSADQCGVCATTGGDGTLPGIQTQSNPDDYYYYSNAPAANPFIQQPATTFPPMMPMQPMMSTQPSLPAQSSPSNVQPIPYMAPSSSPLLNSNTPTGNSTTSQAAQDLLNALVGGVTSTPPVTSAPVTVAIYGTTTQTAPTPTTVVTPQQTTIVGQPIAQQTFTSGDLSGNTVAPVAAPQIFQNFSPIQGILSGIKSVLVHLLAFLQGH